MPSDNLLSAAAHLNCWLLLLLTLAVGLLLPRALVAGEAQALLVLQRSPARVLDVTAERLTAKPGRLAPRDRSGGSDNSPVVSRDRSGGSDNSPKAEYGGGNATLCEPAHRWPPHRLPRRPLGDWMFAADGGSTSSWAAHFRFSESASSADGRRGHLINRLSSGCINLRPGGQVRGHCNSDPQNHAAPPSASTELFWQDELDGGAGDAAGGCERPATAQFRFTRTPSASLTVREDSSIGTARCAAGNAACTFELIPVDYFSSRKGGQRRAGRVAANPTHEEGGAGAGGRGEGGSGWFVMRSVLSGHYLRLHHAEMPEDPSWDGIKQRAVPRHTSFTAGVVRPPPATRGMCPVRGRSPAGWRYNATLWEPVVQQFLGPWSDGNLSATVLDMAYWKAMYGWARARGLPGVHVNVAGGTVRAKTQVDYRLELFRDMMRSVSKMVRLPDVEFVAHLWDHPKVHSK